MKANELRIGNWIENPFLSYCQVSGVDSLERTLRDEEDYKHDILDCKPIPLDEEWLLKMGFILVKRINRVNKKNGYTYKFGEYFIVLNKYTLDDFHSLWDEELHEPSQMGTCIHGKLTYVHQLQNLYFSLTGEELEIK